MRLQVILKVVQSGHTVRCHRHGMIIHTISTTNFITWDMLSHLDPLTFEMSSFN